jgi:alginate O-acetyltransferase complex protein AlgJ
MNPPVASTSPRRAWTDWLLILVFAGVILLPTVDYFTHIDITQAPVENRFLAPWPRLTRLDISGVRNYLAAANSYFNDHFGFRKRLVRWCQQWKYRLFHTQTDLVIAGQNGWLYISEREMIQHYLGMEKFTEPQLQSWQRLLEKRRDWLAARGIKYLFVIPPDKQSVYPENLPAWLLAATPAGRQTKLDQFMQYMKAHSTVEVLDLRQPLIAAKKIVPTYLQNDTHWNLYGGFTACQEMVRALSPQLPGLPPLRSEDFDWTNVPATGGELAKAAGLDPPEKNYFMFTPNPAAIAPRNRDAANIVRLWNPVDPHRLNSISENTNPLAGPFDLVIFHDSFGKAMQPFLGYSFHKIVWIFDSREFNPAIITNNHPQVVVNEILERFVNTEDPGAMQARDALPSPF